MKAGAKGHNLQQRQCKHCHRSTVIIGARGLCSTCYGKHRGAYPVLQPNRPFTAGERDFIIRNYRSMAAKAIAAKLGRKVTHIHEAAFRFGVARQRVLFGDYLVKRRVKSLYKRGYSTGQMAKKIGVTRVAIAQWIKRFGYPPIGETEWSRQQKRRHMLERIEEEGLEEVNALCRRYYVERVQATEAGWPAGCTLYESRVLESLYQHGDSTNPQLVEDTQICMGTMKNLTCNLHRRGWIVGHYRDSGGFQHFTLANGFRKFSDDQE